MQEARNVIHHLKTINDGPAARQASDQACNVIENLVTAYSRKCDDAARSEKVTVFTPLDLTAAPFVPALSFTDSLYMLFSCAIGCTVCCKSSTEL